MANPNRVEILIAGHEMEAHRFFQTEHAKLSSRIYELEISMQRKFEKHTGHPMNERQLNTLMLANASLYVQLGVLDRIMIQLREKAGLDR